MPTGFPSPPADFVARDDYVSRFKARLEHFRFFYYGGIAGIGKSALLLRLARETKRLGLKGAIFLPIWAGEAIASILARVEAHATGGTHGGGVDRQGDPFARLMEFLETKRLVLILDDLHRLRREDLLSLIRTAWAHEGRARVLGAGRGDPDLSAIDRVKVHIELVGPLSPVEATKIAQKYGVSGDGLERISADTARNGLSAHPLTLRYLLGSHGADVPGDEFFAGHSARSVHSFRVVAKAALDRLPSAELATLTAMARVNMPVAKTVASRAFGTSVNSLIKRGLVLLVAGDVMVHELVGSSLPEQGGDLSDTQAGILAKHLQSRGDSRQEPVRVLRAAELLARVGMAGKAVDTLTTVWLTARDFGFLEAYLKSVAFIPATGNLAPRLKLLSARARMRQGSVHSVREELESLAKSNDSWTQSRALTALTYVYSRLGEYKNVVSTFESIRRAAVDIDLLVPAAVTAATAMVRTAKIADAEKLSRSMLTRIKGKKKYQEQEGELHRLLARVYSRMGRLADAVREAQAAAKAFEVAGDLYHAATAHGFIGDLYRETGDFELAKEAFVRFRQLAETWGDRDLLQVAELADAWVSLDIGDLTHAAREIAAVEKEMSAAPSRRLKRYLASARALLEAGRGHHEDAALSLVPVIELWETAGQRSIADILRAQRVRSLISCNELQQARQLVDKALSRLDPKTAAPRVASFLRESALIRLRRKDVKRAMAELAQARKLFGKGGNRREEALTIYRIAHAAFEEGDVGLAASSAKEALSLARKIKHPRVLALARELQGRIALIHDDAKAAVAANKEAQQALRRLGDDLGTLHVSESLLRALIAAGDLATAIRLGPKVSDHAEKLEIREVRIRAVVLTGVALLRRGRREPASRCFREVPDTAFSPLTTALMWRLGEALASVKNDVSTMLARRAKWVAALRRMPEAQQGIALHLLEQLDLPPRERCILRTRKDSRLVGTEEAAWLDLAGTVELFVDVENRRVFVDREPLALEPLALSRLFNRLVIVAPKKLSNAAAYEAVFHQPAPEKPAKPLKAPVRQLLKQLKGVTTVGVTVDKDGLTLSLPKRYALLLPRAIEFPQLSRLQRASLRLMRRFGTLPVQVLQQHCKLTRSAMRRELNGLIEHGLVEAVRDGRGQAFRLA